MMKLIRNFIRDERGEDLIEYGLLAAFVATVGFLVIVKDPLHIGTAVCNAFNRAKSALDNS